MGFKMNGFSGFGNSPLKQDKKKKKDKKPDNWIHRQMKKPGVPESALGFMAGGSKGLEALGYGAASLAGSAYGLFKGYSKLAKTKHGKEIIKGARPMPGKI